MHGVFTVFIEYRIYGICEIQKMSHCELHKIWPRMHVLHLSPTMTGFKKKEFIVTEICVQVQNLNQSTLQLGSKEKT